VTWGKGAGERRWGQKSWEEGTWRGRRFRVGRDLRERDWRERGLGKGGDLVGEGPQGSTDGERLQAQLLQQLWTLGGSPWSSGSTSAAGGKYAEFPIHCPGSTQTRSIKTSWIGEPYANLSSSPGDTMCSRSPEPLLGPDKFIGILLQYRSERQARDLPIGDAPYCPQSHHQS
jgi:hypothetical protein